MRWTRKAWLVVTGAIATLGGIAYAAVASVERMTAPPYVAELLADLPAAAERLAPHSPAREAIESGELESAHEMLSFRPRAEAPIPEGFPAYTPVGVIELKTYPSYRKAVGASFWPLFSHIQTQGIPMTAPVEMNRADSVKGDGQMAFLYQNTKVGSPGAIDRVEVTDTAATIVASLGMRGRMNEATAADAAKRLEDWLATQSEYRRQGTGEASFRVFGYNSPMVPDREKYWEVQLLLEPAK
ncbi:heme-binding protein [Botrimarina hoheduenensis]|uniref:SOUL heme-binding protein n=1 Tax=Botrimarina hoheduenensis TaxID=2528000 RepID=A0A5C5WBH3_9BACT|nr:heme-binding protein [Botrimarina hoheduenensis]TWT48276.1 SOUL heme-binding protein [Botrimarina hoheduenensis]